MHHKFFIPLLLGSVREGRRSELAAKFIYEQVRKHPEIETQFFDPKKMKFPMNDEGESIKSLNPEYRNAIVRSDGLIIVAPEYNHGYSGSLKMTLDMLLEEYKHKAVGLCGVSKGALGGGRMVEQLLGVVRELGLVVISKTIYFPKVEELFDADGNVLDNSYYKKVDGFLAELVWMAKTLRWGRENVTIA